MCDAVDRQKVMSRHSHRPDSILTRRRALAALAATGVGTIATATASAAPGPGRCDLVVPEDHSSIQAAVDAAAPGNVVCVRDGTYREQVVIDRDLTLRAARGASPTIEAGDSPASFTIAESGPTWEPLVFAYGGTESGGSVSGSGTVDVSVEGFALDGRGTQPDARRKPAVLYRNASGDVAGNTVTNMGVGGKETFGVLAYGDSAVRIRGNSVSDYERGGIGANGDGGAHPSPSVDIRGNDLSGSTGLGEVWGPNGIQVGFGATGRVVGNAVADNRYSDEGSVAAGILVFESDDVGVRGNEVANADIGLSVGSWGWLQRSASGNRFVQNDVSDVEYGALVEAVAEPYDGALTESDPTVANTKVVNNAFVGESDPEGQVGLGVVVEDNVDNEYDPTAENTKLVRNTVQNFETDVKDEGTGTKLGPIDP